MTELTTSNDETGPVTSVEPTECANLVVTTSSEHFQQCANPFCKAAIEPLPDGQYRRTRRRFCSDACKYDYDALRRVKALFNWVGVIRFHELMDKV